MKNKILSLLTLSLAALTGCETFEGAYQPNGLNDFYFVSSSQTGWLDKNENYIETGDKFYYMNASQGYVDAAWVVPEGCYFIDKDAPEKDAAISNGQSLSDYILNREENTSHERTVSVLFEKPGIKGIALQCTFADPIMYTYTEIDKVYSGFTDLEGLTKAATEETNGTVNAINAYIEKFKKHAYFYKDENTGKTEIRYNNACYSYYDQALGLNVIDTVIRVEALDTVNADYTVYMVKDRPYSKEEILKVTAADGVVGDSGSGVDLTKPETYIKKEIEKGDKIIVQVDELYGKPYKEVDAAATMTIKSTFGDKGYNVPISTSSSVEGSAEYLAEVYEKSMEQSIIFNDYATDINAGQISLSRKNGEYTVDNDLVEIVIPNRDVVLNIPLNLSVVAPTGPFYVKDDTTKPTFSGNTITLYTNATMDDKAQFATDGVTVTLKTAQIDGSFVEEQLNISSIKQIKNSSDNGAAGAFVITIDDPALDLAQKPTNSIIAVKYDKDIAEAKYEADNEFKIIEDDIDRHLDSFSVETRVMSDYNYFNFIYPTYDTGNDTQYGSDWIVGSDPIGHMRFTIKDYGNIEDKNEYHSALKIDFINDEKGTYANKPYIVSKVNEDGQFSTIGDLTKGVRYKFSCEYYINGKNDIHGDLGNTPSTIVIDLVQNELSKKGAYVQLCPIYTSPETFQSDTDKGQWIKLETEFSSSSNASDARLRITLGNGTESVSNPNMLFRNINISEFDIP